MKIPPSLIGVVANVMADEYTHDQLDMMFLSAGFPEHIPPGSKPSKLMEWQRNANRVLENSLECLGQALAEYLDQPTPSEELFYSGSTDRRKIFQENSEKIKKTLAREGLFYHRGGNITLGGIVGATRSLEERLHERPVDTIQEEFTRALENIEKEPRHSLDAACALLESTCKFYLTRSNIKLPTDKSLKPLWSATAKGLGLDPSMMEDNDLKKILSGLYSVVDGIASIRTHAGGAHGGDEPEPGKKRYRVKSRHARLAVHSAHTLALFVLETWEK